MIEQKVKEIIERKKKGIDNTESESAEIKGFVKEHIVQVGTGDVQMIEDIQTYFPIEYGEAIDEMEKMSKGGKAGTKKKSSAGEKIGSYLPIFSGFYNTIFQADEEQVIEHPYKYDDYDFDYEGYQQDVAKECVKQVEEWLEDFDIKVKFEELISPREYNFANDSINVEYTLGKDSMKKILDYLEENKEAFAKYIKERYTSRSGFISSYSNDSNEWIADLKDESSLHHKLGSVLEFILENEGHDEHDLYDAISSSVYLSGELKQEVKDNQEYIENYAKEHYKDKSQDEIAEDVMKHFNEQDIDYSEKTVRKIIKETFSEVEDKSMKMFNKGGKTGSGKFMTDYSKVSYIPSDTAHKQEPLIIGVTEDDAIYYVDVNNNRNHWSGQPEPERGFSMSGSTAEIYTYDEAKKYAKQYWEDFFWDKREIDDLNERLGKNFRSAKSASQYVLDVDGELHGFDDDRQLGEVDYKNKTWIFHAVSGGQIDSYMNPDKLKRVYVDEKTLKQLRDMWKKYHLKKLPADMQIPVVEQDKDAILIDAIKTARAKECGGEMNYEKGGKAGSALASFIKSYADDGALISAGGYFSSAKMARGGVTGADFSKETESMFEMLSAMSESGKTDPALDKMLDIAENKDSSKENLIKFGKLAKEVKDEKLRKEISKIIKNIVGGRYKNEFKYSYGGKKSDYRSSTAKEFFSFFSQGYTYGKMGKGGKAKQDKKYAFIEKVEGILKSKYKHTSYEIEEVVDMQTYDEYYDEFSSGMTTEEKVAKELSGQIKDRFEMGKGGRAKDENKIGIDWQSKFSSEEKDIIEANVLRLVSSMIQNGNTSGEIYDDSGDTNYRGHWEVVIEEDDNDEDIRNEEVARLIMAGNTSGYNPTFTFSANIWKD